MSQEHYGYDQQEIDYKINKYTLSCLKVTFIVVCAVMLANELNIFVVSQELMMWGVLSFTFVFFVTIILCKCVDLHKSWVKYALIFNTVVAVTVAGVALTYHTVLLSVLPLLLAVQYSNKKVVIYTYILTILSTFTIVMGGYYWGLCDANMLTLTTERTRDYMDAAGGIQFTVANDNPWYTLPLYYVIPRCILLLLLYPVIRSIVSNIADYTKYAVSMKRLSETDEMTGLHNKNKYLQMLEEEYPKVENVVVIFWDVNNLKIINDTLGHTEGDYVITSVASLIKDLTSERRKAYRIGGDEFVMVVENPRENEITSILEQWKIALKRRNSFSKIYISVASGYASGAGRDIKEIARKADEQMYLDKCEQHSRSGSGTHNTAL